MKTRGKKGATRGGSKKTGKKRGRGRPKKWTDEKKEDLLRLFREFIDERDFPVIQTFCAEHHIWPQRLNEWPEFKDVLEICKNKAISYLIENGINNTGGKPFLVPSFSIFAMKNMAGWRDNVSVEHSGAIDPVQGMSPDDRAKLIATLIAKRNVDGD